MLNDYFKLAWENIAHRKLRSILTVIGIVIGIAAVVALISLGQGVKKVILQAHSLTQKILFYQNIKNDKRVVGQIHISPCNDAGYMYYLLGEEKYKETNKKIEEMVKNSKTKELLPAELSVVCPMGALPYFGYLTEDGAGNLFPYHNPQSPKWKILNETEDPLLAIFGGADGFIKPSIEESAKLFKLNAKLAKSLKVEIIDGAPHSYIGFEEKLVQSITDWVKLLCGI